MRLKIHFVGIGGIGMSGIAEVFHIRGYAVSGSDLFESEATRHLRDLGVQIALGHHAANVKEADVLVTSSAVPESNPEVQEARKRRIPVIPRAEMLGELMRGKTGVAVAGSHGKTTTTSLIAQICTQANLDPTVVIGGRVDTLGGNARSGTGDFVIAEADESDGSFVHLPATYALVTNVDNDHLDHFGSMARIEEAFAGFVNQLPFYGSASLCLEDPGVRRILPKLNKPFTTYGLQASECDLWATGVAASGFGSRFKVFSRERGELGEITLAIPGEHNVLNALGAISVTLKLGIEFGEIARALAAFKGVRRRFEVKWKSPEDPGVPPIWVVDDYGHHPTEIRATLQAARSGWAGRIVVAFQPHRFTRTVQCWNEFLDAFEQADVLFMTELYAAGEEPIEGVSAERLLAAVAKRRGKGSANRYLGDWENAVKPLLSEIRPGDLVLCLGAGSITRLSDRLEQALGERVGPKLRETINKSSPKSSRPTPVGRPTR